MEHTIKDQKTEAARLLREQAAETMDGALLWGVPVRHFRQPVEKVPAKSRFSVLNWFRVPLLSLGIIGALGLLAHYNPRFAEASRLIAWPGWVISVIFLGLAGCVFVALLIESIGVRASRYLRSLRRRGHLGQIAWRDR